MVHVGIIGCGHITQRRHAPEYHSNKNAKLVGYFDFNKTRSEEMAQKYGGQVYDSIEDLLADPYIDAVSVCTANKYHASITIQALKAGKDVLCEKPMATTVEEAQAMVDTARETGRFLMIAQNQRFNMGHIRGKELIAQGIIGKPLTFRTTFGHGGPEAWCRDDDGTPAASLWFYDKNMAAMGAMADLGIHKTDLIQYLLDDRITDVTAKMMTLDKRKSDGTPIELEDNAICIYRMASGVVGTMTASWTYYGEEDNSTVIFGTRGVMRLYDNSSPHTIQINTKRGDHIYYDLDQMMTNENQRQSGVISEFIREIETGDHANAANDLSVNAMKAVKAGFESSRLDKTIRL